MNFKPLLIKPLAAAALWVMAGASQATITFYTSQASFTAATSAPGLDTFAGFSTTSSIPGPLVRSAGAYSYTVDSGPVGGLFGGGTSVDPFLSTDNNIDTITFNAFSSGVAAIGGSFFPSTDRGAFIAGRVTMTATDASGTFTQTFAVASISEFVGFVSTSALTSVTICAVYNPLNRCILTTDSGLDSPYTYPSVDNLILARPAAPIPEPSAYAMLLAGLGAIGVVARRRRA
jgi:PEP-CTERM motif